MAADSLTGRPTIRATRTLSDGTVQTRTFTLDGVALA